MEEEEESSAEEDEEDDDFTPELKEETEPLQPLPLITKVRLTRTGRKLVN